MKILLVYLKRYWKLSLLVVILAAVNQVFSLFEPIIFQRIIDNYALRFHEITQAEFFHGTILLLLVFVGNAFISRIAKNFQDYYLNTVSQRSGADMYREGVRHSLDLPYSVFEDERSGETLGKLQKARQDTEKLVIDTINVVFISAIILIFILVYGAMVYWLIPIIFVGMMVVVGGITVLFSRKIKTIQQKIVAETTALAGATTESLRNIELVKALGLAGQEVDRLNAVTEKILKLELKKLQYLRMLDFVQGTVTNFIRAGLYLFLFYLIFVQKITLGQYLSLNIYSFWLFFPLAQITSFISTYRQAEASLENYTKLMNTPAEPKASAPQELGPVTTLEFNNVSFGYKSSTTQALSNISYRASRGETIAFVGPSGSGKTSLVKLLVLLYEPTSGGILYNGIAHTDIDKEELRAQIGFVTQDTQLFSGTIRENLLFVNPSATDDECLDALEKAQCRNLLERGGKGLDTVIGEGGVKVSGGEKQRLSIARALLRKPHILIFDEATSALDSITEAEIGKTIRDVSTLQSHITVLIAHRLSTIMHADRIYVLEKGVVAEAGTHEELLDTKGLYSAMWRQQIGERV
ncbi:MAG: ABC-type multidrug transport system, ATPase and permease component [Parcubacteria group bacterium]|nr:ABC-type multidrug transport system, ATPase and permease component [Parcubacteria group bacterium]